MKTETWVETRGMTTARPTSRWLLVVTGSVIGLTWACALRGWMIHMAAAEGSAFHWLGTFALVLGPGLLVGALIGLAEHRRRTGGPRSVWLNLAPCLFLAALVDPTIFKLLITQGIGGGAIGVVLFGLAGGYALSGRGRAWWRRTCGVFAVIGVLFMVILASDSWPLETAHGLWVGLYASSLLALLCLACAIPQRIGRPTLIPARWIAVAVGALAGFAWAAGLRAFMWEVAGANAAVDWVGTFAWVLLPGTAIGGLLGWAEHRRWTGPVPHRRWLVWSPMLFTALFLQDPLDVLSGFDGGIGLAAVAVPAICMAGGYAIAGRWAALGPRCGRHDPLGDNPDLVPDRGRRGRIIDVPREPPWCVGCPSLLGPARDLLDGRSDPAPSGVWLPTYRSS